MWNECDYWNPLWMQFFRNLRLQLAEEVERVILALEVEKIMEVENE